MTKDEVLSLLGNTLYYVTSGPLITEHLLNDHDPICRGTFTSVTMPGGILQFVINPSAAGCLIVKVVMFWNEVAPFEFDGNYFYEEEAHEIAMALEEATGKCVYPVD